MIVPVRCTSCGKPIGQLWQDYKERAEKGQDKKKIMDDLGLKRYCCRAVFMGHVDLADLSAKFAKY